MIPISVRMKGWMRYRDEQIADFGEGRLIAICGENGAGKSSIFDAITFALYGRHRLGKQHVEDLISEDLDYAAVDLEFEVDGQRYLVHRGRGRKAGDGKQSLYTRDAGPGEWIPLKGTEKEDVLDRSIRQITRLSYEAFTSSFMLQQGEATEFIDADPKPRFEILASLIGLDAYKELERRSREAEKSERDKLKWIKERLADVGDVDETTIAQLRAAAQSAAERESAAAALAQMTAAALADARRYARLTAEIAALEAEIAQTATLLSQREKIESDAHLYEMFSSALEAVGRVRDALSEASRARAAAEEARTQATAIDVAVLTAARAAAAVELKETREHVRAAEKASAASEETDRVAHDFAALAAAVLEGRQAVASLAERVAEIDAQLRKLSAAGKQLGSEAGTAREVLERTDAALETARKEGATWRARADELKRQLADRRAAAKEATCSRCGQPIDKKAAKAQVDELAAQLEAAQKRAADATAAEQFSSKAHAAAKKALDAAVTALGKHDGQRHRLEGEEATVAASAGQARTALAEREARLDGRLKDVDSARASYEAAAERRAHDQAALKAARAADDAAAERDQHCVAALEAGKERLATLELTAVERGAVAEGQRTTAAAIADGLGELGERALGDPGAAIDALERSRGDLAGAPKLKAALDQARETHIAAMAQREVKLQDVAAIPEAHRVDVAVASEATIEAERAYEAAQADRQAAQQAVTGAEALLAQACGLRQEAARAAIRQKRLHRLTALLGKGGLQGALVLDALNQIGSHANAFLKRLTGGSLQLSVERGKDGDALELRAIDSTCMREAHPVKVLSGSQKFRCAVAIASGIGQYAGAGGMRSIVIDEGFASLDRDSQLAMVDELKELSEHMDKVIVVSHLEAFTDPYHFPHQIHVETHGNASVITS